MNQSPDYTDRMRIVADANTILRAQGVDPQDASNDVWSGACETARANLAAERRNEQRQALIVRTADNNSRARAERAAEKRAVMGDA